MGYGYLAVGGMVPLRIEQIEMALATIREWRAPGLGTETAGMVVASPSCGNAKITEVLAPFMWGGSRAHT